MQTYDNKAQCSPKATLPKATDFSDILTMDLKELTPGHKEGGYRYILYVIDEFTKYKKAVLIRDMEAGMIINAVHNGLGHGEPRLHIYSNNMTEFTTNLGEQFSQKLGIIWHYTPSHSPHSNGSCERNHYTVDRYFEKIYMKAKKTTTERLRDSVFAANTQPTLH